MRLLKDKVALVTGSSSGIGAGIARLFAQHGAKVAVHGRDMHAAAAVQAEIERAGGWAIPVTPHAPKLNGAGALRRENEKRARPINLFVANYCPKYTKPRPPEDT